MLVRDYFATIFLVAAGTLLHFVFQWSGNSIFLSPFCPVNESVWEHLKMAYWPALVVLLIECRLTNESWKLTVFARSMGVLSTCLLIVFGAYINEWIFGKHFLFLDIILFVVSVAAGQCLSRKLSTDLGYSGFRQLVSGIFDCFQVRKT